MQIVKNIIGDILKVIYKLYEARRAAGLTITQLEELSGVSKSQINRIENSQSDPTVTTICMLAEALGVEPCDLFFIEKD